MALKNQKTSIAVLTIDQSKYTVCWSNPSFDKQFAKLLNFKLFIPLNQSIN